MSIERRRFFRITDTIGLSFRLIIPQITDLKLSTAATQNYEILEKLECELDKILSPLWASDPPLARAISLLNQKIELLAGDSKPIDYEIMERFDYQYPELEVSLSASGIAFTSEAKIGLHDRLEMQMLLGDTKSRLITKGTVVNVDEREIEGEEAFFTCVDFDIEVQKREQLIQYILQRQIDYIGKQKV